MTIPSMTCKVCAPYGKPGYQLVVNSQGQSKFVPCYGCNRNEFIVDALKEPKS